MARWLRRQRYPRACSLVSRGLVRSSSHACEVCQTLKAFCCRQSPPGVEQLATAGWTAASTLSVASSRWRTTLS